MKKIYALRFMPAIIIVSAASSILAPAAVAGEMKSDPDNYYLDPEEIRPIVREDVEGTVMLWRRAGGPEGIFGKIKEFDVRLLTGQIPLYTIDGEIAAYIYIAYVIPGPLPTIEEIITEAKKISDARDNFIRNKESTGASLRAWYADQFPCGNNCVFALYGVNEHCTSGIENQGIPEIIYGLKKAEDAARNYYGSKDLDYVGFIFSSKKQGYEFTDGRENIIVPMYWRSGVIYPEDIVTRDEVDANKDNFRLPINWERVEKWAELWKRKLSESGSNCDSKVDNEIPDYGIYAKGPWCYLHQTYYDDKQNKLWKNGWYYDAKSPFLNNRNFDPRQYALFGTCNAIACGSVLAYYEGRGNWHLRKNDWEWEKVPGFGGGTYYYPGMRQIELNFDNCKYSGGVCNYAAYMCLLIGAIYQNHAGFSFFNRGQGTLGGGYQFLVNTYSALLQALKDFGAESSYKTHFEAEKPPHLMCWTRIDGYSPFIVLHEDSPVDHGVAIYGYQGYDPGPATVDKLGFFDWYDVDWPSSVNCEYDFYNNFSDYICINDNERFIAASYVNNIEIKRSERRSEICWTNEAVTELGVLGYNVVERGNSENRLNEKIIRPDARFRGGKYKLKLPADYDIGRVAIQAVLKNGETVEYPVAVDEREVQEDVR